ncbi:hypothetical protein ABIF99_011600 [Bradyrhizobium japonicum]
MRAIMPSTVDLISSMGREHVGVDRFDPVVAGPVAEIAGRRAAGIVDQDVRLGAGLQHGLAARRRRDVADDLGDLHARIGFADVVGRLLQGFGAARGQRDVNAGFRQRDGAGAAEALAGCADDGAATFDPKIHCFTPVMSGRF